MKKYYLLFFILTIFVSTLSADTSILTYKNSDDWLNNRQKPVNGEKILRNFLDLEKSVIENSNNLDTHINSFNADSISKDLRISIIEADSISKSIKINIFDNFKNSITDTFYTKISIDNIVNQKADITHNHNNLYLSKSNTEPYTPTNDYQPATVKYVRDFGINSGTGFDTDYLIDLILTTIEPDSITKDLRISNIVSDLNYNDYEIGVLQNENVLQSYKISKLESDSALKLNIADSNIHTHTISSITDSIPYSRLSNTPIIPDTFSQLNFNPLFPPTGSNVRHPLLLNAVRLDAGNTYIINLSSISDIPDNANGVILSYEFITPDTITSMSVFGDAVIFRRGELCSWAWYDIALPYKLYTGNINNNYGIFLFNYTYSGQLFLPIENKKFSICIANYWVTMVLRVMGWF